MNDVKFLEQSPLTEVPLGTMVRLEEDVTKGAKVYMLVEKEHDRGILVNLTDGKAWSWYGIALYDGAADYASFKKHCNVPFTFIHSVGIATKGGK